MKQSLIALAVAIGLSAMLVAERPAAADAPSHPVSHSRGQVTVSAGIVKLGDLFTNAGPAAEATVDQAPPPGGETAYDVYRLAAIARAHGLVWQAQSWSERVVVMRPGRTIEADEIRAAIRDALEAEGLPGKWELLLSRGTPPIHVPLEHTAAPRVSNLDLRRRTGHFTATVTAGAAAAAAQGFTVSGRIHQLIEVPTMNRRLKSGDVIRRSDIKWLNRRAERVNRNVITDADQLIGMTPRRFLAAGQVVRAGDIRKPRMVKKGAIVTMVVTTPHMVLTSKGRAMEHGSRGDTVRIMNLKSKTVVESEVTGPNAVSIATTVSPPAISTARR